MLEGMTGGPKPGAHTHNEEDAMCVSVMKSPHPLLSAAGSANTAQ